MSRSRAVLAIVALLGLLLFAPVCWTAAGLTAKSAGPLAQAVTVVAPEPAEIEDLTPTPVITRGGVIDHLFTDTSDLNGRKRSSVRLRQPRAPPVRPSSFLDCSWRSSDSQIPTLRTSGKTIRTSSEDSTASSPRQSTASCTRRAANNGGVGQRLDFDRRSRARRRDTTVSPTGACCLLVAAAPARPRPGQLSRAAQSPAPWSPPTMRRTMTQLNSRACARPGSAATTRRRCGCWVRFRSLRPVRDVGWKRDLKPVHTAALRTFDLLDRRFPTTAWGSAGRGEYWLELAEQSEELQSQPFFGPELLSAGSRRLPGGFKPLARPGCEPRHRPQPGWAWPSR